MNAPNGPIARDIADVCRMGVVVQANVVQLRVEEKRRGRRDSAAGVSDVASPGAVKAYRDALIEARVVRSYSDVELHLRAHEVWGRFCLLCWAVHTEPDRRPNFSQCAPATELRCASSVAVKAAEVEGSLWRLRFEQRVRHEHVAESDPEFEADRALAARIPVMVLGESVEVCDGDSLLVCACEHAGMLASLRWLADSALAWNQPGIMDASRPELVD